MKRLLFLLPFCASLLPLSAQEAPAIYHPDASNGRVEISNVQAPAVVRHRRRRRRRHVRRYVRRHTELMNQDGNAKA